MCCVVVSAAFYSFSKYIFSIPICVYLYWKIHWHKAKWRWESGVTHLCGYWWKNNKYKQGEEYIYSGGNIELYRYIIYTRVIYRYIYYIRDIRQFIFCIPVYFYFVWINWCVCLSLSLSLWLCDCLFVFGGNKLYKYI